MYVRDELDELDFGVLHLLQQDARHTTPIDTAKRVRLQYLQDCELREGLRQVQEYFTDHAVGGCEVVLRNVSSSVDPVTTESTWSNPPLGVQIADSDPGR